MTNHHMFFKNMNCRYLGVYYIQEGRQLLTEYFRVSHVTFICSLHQKNNFFFRMNIEWRFFQLWIGNIGTMHLRHNTSDLKCMFFRNIVYIKGVCIGPWINQVPDILYNLQIGCIPFECEYRRYAVTRKCFRYGFRHIVMVGGIQIV